jgi:hypothetical protein
MRSPFRNEERNSRSPFSERQLAFPFLGMERQSDSPIEDACSILFDSAVTYDLSFSKYVFLVMFFLYWEKMLLVCFKLTYVSSHDAVMLVAESDAFIVSLLLHNLNFFSILIEHQV